MALPSFATLDRLAADLNLPETGESPVSPSSSSQFQTLDRLAADLQIRPGEAPIEPTTGFGRTLADFGIKGAQGVVDFGQSLVGLSSLATGGLTGKFFHGTLGYDPGKTNDFLGDYLSDAHQESERAITDAKGFVETLVAAATHPRGTAGLITESLPSMLGMGAPARLLAEQIAIKAALPFGGLATTAGAAAAEKAIEAAAGKLMWVSGAAEGAQQAGALADTAQSAGVDYSQYALPAVISGALDAAIVRGAGKLIGDPTTALFAGYAKAGGVTGGYGARILKSIFSEGVLQELPQSAQEQIFQNVAVGKPWDEGVANQAAIGAVLGSVLGGGMAALTPGETIKPAHPAQPDREKDTPLGGPPSGGPPAEAVETIPPTVPALPGVLDLAREHQDAALAVQHVSKQIDFLESAGLVVPGFLKEKLAEAKARFAKPEPVVQIPTEVLTAESGDEAAIKAAEFVDGPTTVPAIPASSADVRPFDRPDQFQTALEQYIGTDVIKETQNAANQDLLVRALARDTQGRFREIDGQPMWGDPERGQPYRPIRAIAPEGLPDVAVEGGQVTRAHYRAASSFAGLFGKRVIVFDELPGAEGFAGVDRSIIFLGSKTDNPVLAVIGHELGHLLEGTPAYQIYQQTVFENLDPRARTLLRTRHGDLSDEGLLNEASADIKGDAWMNPAFHTKLVARLREKLGDAETKSILRQFLDMIRDLIQKFTIRSKTEGGMTAEYQSYISNLDKIYDTLATAVAEAYLKGPSAATAEKGKLALSKREQAGEGAREVVHPEAVEKFKELASLQRAKPEAAMLDVQLKHGGGVLNPVVEHVGDLVHRMSEAARWGTAQRELVLPKIERALGALTHSYGFEKEHAENIRNNVRQTTITTAEHRAAVDRLMEQYAAEHRKLPVYNLPQWLAREAAVAVGERNWDKAIARLKELQAIVKAPDYDRQALAVHRDKTEKIIPFEEAGEVLNAAEKLTEKREKLTKSEGKVSNPVRLEAKDLRYDGKMFDTVELWTALRELPVLVKNDVYPHAAIPEGGTVSRQTLEASGYRISDQLKLETEKTRPSKQTPDIQFSPRYNKKFSNAILAAFKSNAVASILQKSVAKSGPFDGGCLIVAKALVHVAGTGELATIASNRNGYQTEHYGALIQDAYYDADGGAASFDEWRDRFVDHEGLDMEAGLEPVEYYEGRGVDEEGDIPDDPRAVKLLTNELNKQFTLKDIQFAPRKHPEHKRTLAGKYVGAPPAVTSPAKLTKLRETLAGLAKEGKPGRHWYEKSGHAVLDLAEGNRNLAEKIVGLIAIYSPRKDIVANTTTALTAYYQWANGSPITVLGVKGFATAHRAQAWMAGTANEHEISGIKRSAFYKNLMRAINPAALGTEAQGVTVDMWMARAMGYLKTTVGKAQYAFTEREIKSLAQRLGWEPQQAQAAVWVAVRSRMQQPIERDGVPTTLYQATREDAVARGWLEKVVRTSKAGNDYTHHKPVDAERGRAFERLLLQRALKLDHVDIDSLDFSDALKARTAQISWEATPGKSSLVLPGIHSADLGQQAEYLAAVDAALRGDYGQDLIAEKLNLAGASTIFGPGAWQGNVTVGAQTRTAVGLQSDADGNPSVSDDARELISLYADIRGYVLSQEGVYWSYPIYGGPKSAANGVWLDFGRALDTQEMGTLYRAIMDAAGHDEWAPAYTENGAFVLNFKTEDQPAFHAIIKQAVGTLPDELAAEMDTFRADGDARTNDWKESPHGESYRDRIVTSGSPVLLEWSEDLRQAVVGVNEDFSRKYDWGNPGEARVAVEEAAGVETDILPSLGRPIQFSPRVRLTLDAQRMADEYDAAPVLEEAARPAWDALRDDTAAKYKQIILKVKVERVTGQPYATAAEMNAAIATGSFKVTTDYSEHPVWTVEENVQFRVVHDYLGHFKTGYDFSLYGEQRAYAEHAKQIENPLARKALRVEVYGQAAAALAHDGEFQVQKVFLPRDPVRNLDAEWASMAGGFVPRGYVEEGREIQFAPRNAAPPYGLKAPPKGAKVPNVQWDADELRENEEALRDDYAQAGPNELEHTIYPTVYRAWVPIGEVPRARVAERTQDAKRGGYDWAQFTKTGIYPPITIQLHPNGVAQSLDDGNHRMHYWRKQNFTHVPAWIVDFRQASLGRPANTVAEFTRLNPDLQLAPRKQPVFYSALQKVLAERMPESTTAEQVRGILNAPGIKQDEIKWSGILDYLEKQKGPVDRQRLLNWLKRNEVKIVDVMKSGEGADDLPSLQEFSNRWHESYEISEDEIALGKEEEGKDWEDDGTFGETVWTHRDYPVKIIESYEGYEIAVYDEKTWGAKKERIVEFLDNDSALIEGGTGRITLRHGFATANEIAYEYFVGKARDQSEASGVKYPGYTLEGPKTDYRELLLTWNRLEDQQNSKLVKELIVVKTPEEQEKVREKISNVPRSPAYTSRHWDEDNILAHVRFDERTDTTGRRTLFVEEIQSDWHQAGRESGYRGRLTDTTGWTAEHSFDTHKGEWNGIWIVNDKNGQLVSNRMSGATPDEAIQKAGEQVGRAASIPDALFSKSWHELALKRMLRLAADEGYDQLAWATGRQQNEQYRLATYVDMIQIEPLKHGKFSVMGWKDERRVVNTRASSEKHLRATIGKELSHKALDAWKREGAPYEPIQFSGLDLEIGGSGMVGFYDQMLPRFLDKYLKRWGAQVGTAEFDFGKYEYGKSTQYGKGNKLAHAIPITDAMRDSVRNESQPQFAPRKRVADQTETPEFKAWFGESKVVDADGKPRVVYHGTREEFSKFEPEGQSDGLFFTVNPMHASDYAESIEGSQVLPVYLSIQNPKIVTNQQWYIDGVAPNDNLIHDGYDGILIKRHEQLEGRSDTWIAFRPEQIKSAIGNRGTFSSENPDIRFAPRGAKPPVGLTRDELPKNAKVPEVDWTREDFWNNTGALLVATKDALQEQYEGMYLSRLGPGRARPVVYQAYVPIRQYTETISEEDEAGEYNWDAFNEPGILPPALVTVRDNRYASLDDGNHRTRYWREMGYTHIPAWVVDFRLHAAERDFNPKFAPRQQPAYTVPEPTKMDKIVRVLQDKNVDIRKFVDAVKTSVADLYDDLNPVLHEEMFAARAAQRTEDFLTDELEPLVKDMQLRNVTQPQLNDYLLARHAKEANARLREINPEREDNAALSSMSDERAAEILAAPESTRIAPLAERIDAIVNKTRDLMVDYGLESPERIAAWREAYQFYVPLRREGHEEEGITTGTGRSVRGSMVRERLGSLAGVDEILGNVALAREATITRGEKMRPVVAMAGLLMAHPNREIAVLDKPAPITLVNPLTGLPESLAGDLKTYKIPRIRRLDPATGVVKEIPDPAYKGRENVVNFRVKGVDYAIVFNERNERAMEIAKAFKDLDVAQLNRLLTWVAPVTRWIASVNTQYNPIFGIINFARDVPFAMLTLTSTPLNGKQLEVLANTKRLMYGIYEDARAIREDRHPTSPAAVLWERFEHVGGPTGYRDLFTTAGDRAKAIESLLNPSTLRQAWIAGGGRAIAGWLSDYNKTMENAVRLGVFKTGIDAGLSDIRAASLAKNITVNFNKKGQIGAQMGSLYAFFNASIQGVNRIRETLLVGDTARLSEAGKRVVAGGVMLGVLQAVILALAGFDDKEPPEYLKEKNLIVPLPGKKYAMIPYPLGFNVLPSLGRLTMETLIYGRPMDRAYQFMATVGGALSPVGGATSWAQFLSPTVTDPIVALGENKDWTGKPIVKEDRDALNPTPGHSRRRDTATPWAILMSRAINYLSGGTEYKPGIASPTPDAIDYLITQATGGVGREISKTVQVGQGLVTGENVPEYKIPLYGRFVGAAEGLAATRGRFYDNLKMINAHELEIKGRLKAHEPLGDYWLRNPVSRLIDTGNQTERAVAELTRQKHLMVKQGQSAERVRLMEERIGGIMGRFNAQVERIESGAGATP